MSNSFVTLAQHQCPVCGKCEDTGEILLDKMMRNKFDMHTVTGFELCSECKKKREDGFVFLVEVSDASAPSFDSRTGRVVTLRESVYDQLFSTPMGTEGMAMCGPDVIHALETMMSVRNAEA